MGVSTSSRGLDIRQTQQLPVVSAARPSQITLPGSCFLLPNLAAASIDPAPAPRPLLVLAMAPKPRKKKGNPLAPDGSSSALEPALEQSTVNNKEGVDKVHHTLVADSNEGRATVVRPASWRTREMSATEIPIYLHALLAGLIPPFSPFFNAMMSHYDYRTRPLS